MTPPGTPSSAGRRQAGQNPGLAFFHRGAGITPTFDLGPFDSDQGIITNPDRTLMDTTDGGSDTIAVFRIATNGSLSHVAGSPFFSGGSNPVSLGLAGNVLCVVNKDNDPDHPGRFLPNDTSFRVGLGGRLAAIPRAAIDETLGSDPRSPRLLRAMVGCGVHPFQAAGERRRP